jgi:hypothetical protein
MAQKSASAESAIQFRRHFIVRPRMHAYLATVCRDLGAEVVRVGSVVTTLPRTVSQAQLIEQTTFLKVPAERSSASPR